MRLLRTVAFAAAAAVGLVLLPGTAAAQFKDWQYRQRPPPPPPQRFLLEIKAGTYSPHIDDTSTLTGTPFTDLFRSQTSPEVGEQPASKLIVAVEFDWQFFRRFGSLGVGSSVGYSRRYTHAFEFNPDGTSCAVPNCVRAGDKTTLNVIPLTMELVYRFDVLALRYHIPVVPYVKAGLGYYFWFIQKGDGGLATGDQSPDSSDHAIGGTFGLVAHPGIAILLDALDGDATRTLDVEIGIHHTYLFFELNYAWITNFGVGDKMVFSDTSWYAGFAAEF